MPEEQESSRDNNDDEQPQPAPLLMTAAQEAAKAQVRFWIRSVLRETALQAVRLQWKLVVLASTNDGTTTATTPSTDGTSSVQVHLDHSDHDVITNAQQVCRTVAHKWSMNLKEMGLHDVARWIQEMVQAENESLYQHPDDPSSFHAQIDTDAENGQYGAGEDDNAAAPPPPSTTTAGSIATTTTIATITRRTEEEDAPSRESDATTRTIPECTTTWAKLRHLGHRDILSGAEDPPKNDTILSQLDTLGAQNATYWPTDQWHVIQAASSDIASRLYSNVPSQRAANELEALQQQPSAVLPPPEDSSAASSTTMKEGAYPQALQYLLLRKRSKRRRIAPRLTTTTTEPLLRNTPDPSRDASSDNGHFRLSWEKDILADNAWTAQEKMQLDALLHDDTNHTRGEAEAEETQSLLLGSLQDLGRFHYFYQLSEDYSSCDNNGLGMLDQWHEKQKRRRQNEALSVRLGDHVKLRTAETEYKKMRMSRVAHTAAAAAPVHTTTTRNPPRWLDLDLGYCMLESVDAATGHRTLYSFGNLELFLLDEDSDVDGL